jgi:hypothetical protein
VVWTVVIAMAWASVWNSECCGGVVLNGVVWIVIISMASPFMRCAEYLWRVVGDGPIRIVFLAMAWMFVRSSGCRDDGQRTAMVGGGPDWPSAALGADGLGQVADGLYKGSSASLLLTFTFL